MAWLIIGAGVSGLGAAKFLIKRGESVRVSERAALPPAKSEAFTSLGVELCDGGHQLAHLDGISSVVVSPGLPPTHSLLVEAARRGLNVLSEIDLALRDFKGQLVAVTGTNGKSTTCAMLGHVLEKAGYKVSVGGNFGDPPTAMLAEERMGDVLVLELSSYQLEQSSGVAPDIAIFTSFSHDHTARHGTLAAYLAAKWRIFEHQPLAGAAIIPPAILELGRTAGLPPPQHILPVTVSDGAMQTADGEALPLAGLGINEPHNQMNAACAVAAAAYLTKRPASELYLHLHGFRGLRHRCEFLGKIRGHAVINDSKSTNVESTLVALASLPRPVLLLMGGQGKGEDYAPLLAESGKIAKLLTFGASGHDIANGVAGRLNVQQFPTLRDAMAAIGGILKEYETPVLFSPGCASFDEFTNYEARGDFFRATIAKYLSD